jgi:hypothetical protein
MWEKHGGKILIVLIIVAVIICIVFRNDHKTLKVDCKAVGGELAVIDQRMSGKTMVDVYGCVNPPATVK